jgi:hypothetical protein
MVTKNASGKMVRASGIPFRDGEGVAVNVSYIPVIGLGGSTTQVATLNLSGAQVPDRRYVADVCAVRSVGDGVKLVFGQTKLLSPDLQTALLVYFEQDSIRSMLKNVREMVSPNLREIATISRVAVGSLYNITSEPDQVVSLAANCAYIAASLSCVPFLGASNANFKPTICGAGCTSLFVAC